MTNRSFIQNRWLYAFDAEADAVANWDAVRKTVEEELATGSIKPLC